MRVCISVVMIAAMASGWLADASAQGSGTINFGDDTGLWSHDGECDDPRFEGPGLAETLSDDDTFHDATDCRAAYEAGTVTLVDNPVTAPMLNQMPVIETRTNTMSVTSEPAIDFGDNTGLWADDGECDDPRFTGEGMAEMELYSMNMGHDANDCRSAFEAGTIWLQGQTPPSRAENTETSESIVHDGINFGDDQGDWANDGECDDPRFAGDGMTPTVLLDEDAFHDASDCLAAWKAGTLRLADD